MNIRHLVEDIPCVFCRNAEQDNFETGVEVDFVLENHRLATGEPMGQSGC